MTPILRSRRARLVAVVWRLCGLASQAWSSHQGSPGSAPSRFRSAEDGAFDVSGFLDQKYGFVP